MNITVGNQAIVVRGDSALAIRMLEALYEDSVLELVETDSLDLVFNHGHRSWIVQEQDGWCAIEELSADSFIVDNLLSASKDFLSDVAYVFYVREEGDVKFRRGAAYIGFYFGIYDPAHGKLEFVQKGLSIDEWEWVRSKNSHQLPVSEASLDRETLENFITDNGIPISFGGMDKLNPCLYVAEMPEKSDEEWAAFFESSYKGD